MHTYQWEMRIYIEKSLEALPGATYIGLLEQLPFHKYSYIELN